MAWQFLEQATQVFTGLMDWYWSYKLFGLIFNLCCELIVDRDALLKYRVQASSEKHKRKFLLLA
jgi:hypothetical protein